MTHVCLIIPVYNYANDIQASLVKLQTWRQAHASTTIDFIFSDDGSSDATPVILQKWVAAQKSGWHLVSSPKNLGKGSAIRRGLKIARSLNPDALIFSDCDLHYGLEIIFDRLLPALATADIAIVDRSWQPTRIEASALRKLASGIFNRCVAILTGVGFRDTQAGLKAFRAESCWPVFELLTINGFAFDVEILSIALFYRLRVRQIAIINRKASLTSRVSMLRSSFRMIFDLITINANWKMGRYLHAELAKKIESHVYTIVD